MTIACRMRQHQLHVKNSRRPSIKVSAESQGPTGLNVGRYRPTSKAGWDQMKASLQSAKMKLLAPQELIFAADKGEIKVLDIRPADLHQQGHIPGAFNVPFYQPIEGWAPWQVVRRVGYALFGVLNGTEPNPSFIAEVEKMVKKDEQLVVYCSIGGSLEGDDINKNGRQTRSMIAAYQLVTNGFTNVSVLRGGFSSWANGGRRIVTAASGDAGGSKSSDAATNRTASP